MDITGKINKKRKVLRVVTLTAIFMLVLTSFIPYATTGLWDTYQYDNRNSSGIYQNVKNPDKLAWHFDTSSTIYSSVSVDKDGIIYFTTNPALGPGKLYALHPNGTEKWSYTFPSSPSSSTPLIYDSDTIIVGCTGDNKLFGIYAKNGTEKWNFETDGHITSSPKLLNNIVYFGSYDNNLYSVYAGNGTQNWNFTTGDKILSSPAIDNSRVYTYSFDGELYCIDLDGNQLWNYTAGDASKSSPAIDKNGIVYVGNNTNHFHAIYPNGTVKWIFDGASNKLLGSASFSEDNKVVYMGSDDDNMYALYSNNGTLKWNYSIGGDVDTSPAIDDKGNLYFGAWDNCFYSLTSNGNLNWKFMANGSFWGSPAISNGRVYVGDAGGILYAFGDFDSVKTTMPSDGDNVYVDNTTIKVVFKDSMNTSSEPNLSGLSTTFEGWYTTNSSNDTAVWTCSTLDYNTTYNLTVTYMSEGSYIWSFTTETQNENFERMIMSVIELLIFVIIIMIVIKVISFLVVKDENMDEGDGYN